jgi:hypothetical protein
VLCLAALACQSPEVSNGMIRVVIVNTTIGH